MLRTALFCAKHQQTKRSAHTAPSKGYAPLLAIQQPAAPQHCWLGLTRHKAASKLCRAKRRCQCLERQGAPEMAAGVRHNTTAYT